MPIFNIILSKFAIGIFFRWNFFGIKEYRWEVKKIKRKKINNIIDCYEIEEYYNKPSFINGQIVHGRWL